MLNGAWNGNSTKISVFEFAVLVKLLSKANGILWFGNIATVWATCPKTHIQACLSKHTSLCCYWSRSKEDAKIKTLILLALCGFVLTVGLALPLSENGSELKNPELKEIASDFQAEDKEK